MWEFSGTTYQVKQDFAANPLLAVAAIGSTVQTTDATPLAGTLCSAVDRLRDYENTKMIKPVDNSDKASLQADFNGDDWGGRQGLPAAHPALGQRLLRVRRRVKSCLRPAPGSECYACAGR